MVCGYFFCRDASFARTMHPVCEEAIMKRQHIIASIIGLVILASLAFGQDVKNTSYKTRTGERVLRYEISLNAPKEEIWKAFTTCNGLSLWLAPIAVVDLRVGGYITTQYEKHARIGDPGTVDTKIVNYIDGEMLTLEIDMNEHFAQLLKGEDHTLQEIIQFVDLGPSQTRLISSTVGWGEGLDWDDAYAFYERGNAITYQLLADAFNKQPEPAPAPKIQTAQRTPPSKRK
jgi:uncharacterized protein YndB with AHSA1/START domain